MAVPRTRGSSVRNEDLGMLAPELRRDLSESHNRT
jgi:hypothetical protein